ncbi:hypothetical protein [Flavobacterium agrisoli]|uniref:MORN repeat protein n=1 Tax=Flavobacterium agrisoli TaxID=2793066 RepID=A0A934UIE4_9FLAO|nr:hypothetical protein [Flavobacterium agrisoli]MBK0368519.1 hypothetical protein [Flavobacterium agrisoli]
MKKVIALCLFTAFSYAQTIVNKIENVNAQQLEFIKKVNSFYPDITVNNSITNYYADGNIIDSKQEFDLKGTKFSSYKIGIQPGNTKMLYEYETADLGKVYGDIRIFNGKYVRTQFMDKSNKIEIYVDGKAVYSN